MNIFKNKSVILGAVVFLVIIILVIAVIFYLIFLSPDSLNPSVKAFVKKVPFLSEKLVQSEGKKKLDTLKENLDEERAKIESEWAKIEEQKRDLEDRKSILDKKEQELTDLEHQMTGLKTQLETSLKDIKDVAQYYELMEPNNAAKILNDLEDEFIVHLFKNMKKESVSRILAILDPKKAASVTKKMSGIQ